MSILAIDSASRETAWALRTTEDGAVLDQREVPGGELDRRLPGALAALLVDELTAVVVLTGPGSYTGVRAGMAAALGVAAAGGLPLHGMGNLAAIAALATTPPGEEFSAAGDAGRGGAYVARFVRRAGLVEQLSAVHRVDAAALGVAGAVFAGAEIPGLQVVVLDPVRVLAAAVPRALALPALAPAGLRAVHAEPAGDGSTTEADRARDAG